MNLGGHAKKHLATKHNIFEDDYMKYYDLVDKPNVEKFKCPLCDWATVDLKNKSGWFTTHLKKKHNLTPEKYVEKYPEHRNLWKEYFKQLEYNNFIQAKSDNRIKCEICGKYFKKITNTHLIDKHNMTIKEYKQKFYVDTTVSTTTSKIQSAYTKKLNKLKKEEYERLDIPMPWHNSKVYDKKVRLNFKKYLEKNKTDFEIYFDYLTYWKGDKFHVKCKRCGNDFKSHTRELRCYKCDPKLKGTSKDEKAIADYIQNELGIEIVTNSRKILNGKELDIYIPNYKLAIEYDGLYFHSELQGKDKNYHLNKTLACEKQGIQLIHIFEDEWLYKQDIVKSRLKHILGITENRIYARKCQICEITSKEKREFLNQYHIQGDDKSTFKYALKFNNEIVAVMTFGKLRVSLGQKQKNDYFELMRYASKDTVIGGASRLLTHFKREHNPIQIISYADRRWSQGGLYHQLGFTVVSDGNPNYWYVENYGRRLHRFNFTKHRIITEFNGNEKKTEWENMVDMGYDRIWDCGSLKYELMS